MLTAEEMALCQRFSRGRKLIEHLLLHPDDALSLSQNEGEEYRLAGKEVSRITTKMIAIMFKVRMPIIICLTTSALLNATDSGGIFSGLLSEYMTIIGDEASQIPEPAVAITTRVPNVRYVYIGDVHQLEPHTHCSYTSIPANFGAREVMDLLIQRRIPMPPLTTTFRSHPELNTMSNRLFYDNV